MTTVAMTAGERGGARMGWGAAMLAAAVVALVRPSTWPIALAGFLARGGLIALALPIVVVPTPSGLANAFAEPATSVIFGHPSTTFVLLVLAGAVLATAAIVLGALVGAWAERVGIAQTLDVARTEAFGGVGGLAGERPIRHAEDLHGTLAGATTLRVLGLVPLGVALAVAGPAFVDAAYRQVILPSDLGGPLVVRILREAAPALVVLVGTWLLGDAAAAAAVRHHALAGRSTAHAWLLGWVTLVRHPLTTLATAALTLVAVAVLVAPALVASAFGWERAGVLLGDDDAAIPILLAALLFVGMWLGGLVLAGAASSFRAAAWTFELARREVGRGSERGSGGVPDGGPSSHPA